MVFLRGKICLAAALAFQLQSLALADTDAEKWLKEHVISSQPDRKDEKKKIHWFDARKLTIEGMAFSDSLTSYSRLSMRHKPLVTEGVWNTGTNSAGVAVRFVTDAQEISVSWGKTAPAMNHMAWSGSGGLDLYARENGEWRFRGVARPTTTTLNTTVIQSKAINPNPEPTEYLMFLGSYSKFDNVEIGIESGKSISPGSSRYEDKLPIVFYGTSITQGGCSSRPGMSHPSILRRWLDYPVFNLGFSGSGKCEPAMADILAEIPSSLYIIETVPNMTAEMIEERVVPFVERLRTIRDTPILMIESPNAHRAEKPNAAFRKACDELITKGIKNLTYLEGKGLYSSRENPTVDDSHPTDLGFYEMAVAYEPVVARILNLKTEKSR